KSRGTTGNFHRCGCRYLNYQQTTIGVLTFICSSCTHCQGAAILAWKYYDKNPKQNSTSPANSGMSCAHAGSQPGRAHHHGGFSKRSWCFRGSPVPALSQQIQNV